VHDDATLLAVRPGDILVLRAPLQGLTRVLGLAGAIVSEEGGVLSNLAIVSRELRLPCILGAAGATDVVHDGDRLLVEAGAGLVSVLASHFRTLRAAIPTV
jgi:pyruvate,water dikinase